MYNVKEYNDEYFYFPVPAEQQAIPSQAAKL